MRLTLQLGELGWVSPRACQTVVRLAYALWEARPYHTPVGSKQAGFCS